ncbi:lipoyl synthase, partial [Salmonella enterica]
VPRLYKTLRPGADYKRSLDLLAAFKKMHPEIPTKSGLMIGLGESRTEIISVMQELHDHGVTMLTLGQYLQPGPYHLPVQRYATPAEFEELRLIACEIGFTHAACGPLVRSSYHAEQQFND